MDATEFTEAVREDAKTELSRIGSSKSLYADTRGEMEEDAVLAAAADGFAAAADVFESWADDDWAAADFFADAAATERDHYETAAGKLDDHEPGDVPALYDYLAGLDEPVERLGGVVGHAAVADKKTDQLVGFYVGQASPQTSQVFREVGDDIDDQEVRAAELLESVCEGDDDWAAAREAATGAISAAYDEYFETLEDLGVNPKPVC
ncbi:rubrerythrin family protein [Haloarculaceae archaeon H-GB2-1]|nr:rubrerythrin family protein [Haloarculaceae archaeon H-GB1-1]MEA5388929.1 rubrerythrin family protein [Haloarculaceae archaeon H-GB11]MEA5406985.1 rubrerythrin family protein [Haloarculaceae archaeon H-GB2-1]